jgi:hypothetical protein
MHPIAHAACPVELVRQQRDADEHEHEPGAGHERQAEHCTAAYAQAADDDASHADRGMQHER